MTAMTSPATRRTPAIPAACPRPIAGCRRTCRRSSPTPTPTSVWSSSPSTRARGRPPARAAAAPTSPAPAPVGAISPRWCSVPSSATAWSRRFPTTTIRCCSPSRTSSGWAACGTRATRASHPLAPTSGRSRPHRDRRSGTGSRDGLGLEDGLDGAVTGLVATDDERLAVLGEREAVGDDAGRVEPLGEEVEVVLHRVLAAASGGVGLDAEGVRPHHHRLLEVERRPLETPWWLDPDDDDAAAGSDQAKAHLHRLRQPHGVVDDAHPVQRPGKPPPGLEELTPLILDGPRDHRGGVG